MAREARLPETEGEIWCGLRAGEHLPPSAFNPEVPPELDALVGKAMSVLPEKPICQRRRFSSRAGKLHSCGRSPRSVAVVCDEGTFFA